MICGLEGQSRYQIFQRETTTRKQISQNIEMYVTWTNEPISHMLLGIIKSKILINKNMMMMRTLKRSTLNIQQWFFEFLEKHFGFHFTNEYAITLFCGNAFLRGRAVECLLLIFARRVSNSVATNESVIHLQYIQY